MKTLITIILLCFLFADFLPQEHFLTHNGYKRTYLLYVPSVYDGSSPYPLIFVFHGSGGSDSALFKSGFNERAEILKYIVVYPSGLNKNWNGPDNDVDFISVLIDSLKKQYNIDTNRIYATGHSAGGFFTYSLAVNLPGKITAAAPVAAYSTTSAQAIKSPVPIMAIHTVDDQVVSYSSDQYGLKAWQQKNQCSTLPDTIYNANGVTGLLWKAKETGDDIEFFSYLHGGHSWMIYPVNITDLIVDFFYNHPKRKSLVEFTSPADLVFNAPANIQLSSKVESEAMVIKVEYFTGSIKIGESSTLPYPVNWTNIPQGDYLIYTKASYNDGTSEISSNNKLIDVLLPDIAVNKPLEYSSARSSSEAANYALDNDLTTRWATPYSDPQWIIVDLQDTYLISNVTIFWGTSYGLAYTIDISPDKKTWETVYETASGKGGTEFINFNPVNARYVRLNGTRRGTPYGYSLWEFQIYGTVVSSITNSKNEIQVLTLKASPNPFNSETAIHLFIPEDEKVELAIYNIAGQKIRTLVSSVEKAGKHIYYWNGCSNSGYPAASGIYICRLITAGISLSCKLIFLK